MKNYNFPFASDFSAQLRADGITVYSVEGCCNVLQTYSRKDFYKISLLTGEGVVTYRNRSVEINGSVLLITKPDILCSWSLAATRVTSYTCVITHEFLRSHCFNWVSQCDLLYSDDPGVYNLSHEQSRFLGFLFQKMIGTQNSAYPFKDELIQDQICVLLHTALRLKPSVDFVDYASTLIAASRHVELVEMMFPSEAQVLHFN